MPANVTHTHEFRPGRWLRAALIACALAYVAGVISASSVIPQETATVCPR